MRVSRYAEGHCLSLKDHHAFSDLYTSNQFSRYMSFSLLKAQKLAPTFAVMTGGTGGIGKQIAEILLAEGWDVLLLTRQPTKAMELISHQAGRFEAILCDLTQPDSLHEVSSQIQKRKKSVGILIHCAGKILPQSAAEITETSLSDQMTVNLISPILLTTQLMPVLSEKSHILFVNSIAGVMPLQGSSIYSATKFGLRGFARSLALEFKPRTIEVSSIFLGAVDTPMLQQETQDGGSILNFVNQPMSARKVASLIVRTSQGPGKEIFLPKIDGIFAHACLIMPWLLRFSTPLLQQFGQRGLRRFMKKRPISDTIKH